MVQRKFDDNLRPEKSLKLEFLVEIVCFVPLIPSEAHNIQLFINTEPGDIQSHLWPGLGVHDLHNKLSFL